MNIAARRGFRRALFAIPLPLWAAACQPLPHPFADDVPKPGSPLMSLPDMASVSVAPLEGGPRATAEKLAPAMAAALQKREIAASSRIAGLDSYELDGRIQAMPPSGDKAALVAVWELRDPSGRLIGSRSERIEAAVGDWETGKAAAVARVAAAGADELAELIAGKPPVATPVVAGRTRLLIAGFEGAPGDGGAALAKAVSVLLERQGVAIVTDPKAAADLVLSVDVAVGPAEAGKQHVKIVWRVRKKGGGEIGTVAQENDVPAGLLDGSWGDVAYTVAAAAQDGIMALVQHGASSAAAAATVGRS